ncbi:hypothetical protein Tco_0363191 [Tanacetum coccineum]
MDTSKHGTIPMQPNVDLSKAQGPSTPEEVMRKKGIPYASVVGESHWTTVKNILKYLRNTKYMFLVYGGDPTTELSVTCYTDASWETNRDTSILDWVIQEGDIRIRKVHTVNNQADLFTKPMYCTKHVEHARNIRLRPDGSFMWELLEYAHVIINNIRLDTCDPMRSHTYPLRKKGRFSAKEDWHRHGYAVSSLMDTAYWSSE